MHNQFNVEMATDFIMERCTPSVLVGRKFRIVEEGEAENAEEGNVQL